MISECVNLCALDYMRSFSDKFFDLAVVDPPYDFSTGNTSFVAKGMHNKEKFNRQGGDKDKGGFCIGGGAKSKHLNSLYSPPNKEYFDELFRVSKNQIIFGGQTFTQYLPPKMGWLVWDKMNGNSYFGDAELAWTSFNGAVRIIRKTSVQQNRIHPTQKPIYLYDALYIKYAAEGQKILDTHLGSGTNRIAAHKNKMNFYSCEIDPFYYLKQEKKFSHYISQTFLYL